MRVAHSWRRTGAALGLALGALVAVMLATQTGWLGPWVAHELTARSGRAARIDSMWVGLSGSLEPVVHMRGVQIANAAWADARRPLIDAGELVAAFSWRTLVADRRLVSLIVLRDASVDLERQADGLRNWRLLDPQNRGPGRYRVLNLQAERSSLHLAMGNVGLALDVKATNSTPDPSLPLRLDFAGTWRDVPFTAQVATGPTLSFYDSATSFLLRGRVEAGAAVLDVDGRAASVFLEPTLDARVVVAAKSLVGFEPFVGTRAAHAGPLKLVGRVQTQPHRYGLSEVDASLGRTDLHGSAVASHESERTSWQADLRSDRLDVEDWRWLLDEKSPARTVVPDPGSPSASAAADAAHGERHWQGTSAGLRYTAKVVHLPAEPALQSVAVEGRLVDGRLDVSRVDVGLGAGHVRGRASIDVHDDRRAASAVLAWQGVRVEQLLRDQKDRSRVTGALKGDLTLSASGRTAHDFLVSATGRVELSLSGGTITSLLDAEMGLQGGRIVRSVLGGNEPIALRCAALSASLERGHGRIRRLVVDSERTRSTGRGTFDLGTDTVDLVLTPEAKQGGLFVLDRSILLHGPLRKPEKSLVDRAAETGAGPGPCASS